MGRLPNDGRGRIGGRSKGTQNKPQSPLPVWVSELINKHRKNIEKTLLTPWTPEATNLLSALMIVGAIQGLNLFTVEDSKQTNED